MADQSRIIDVRHPYWTSKSTSWRKWRLVYEGGDCFVDQFVEKFSTREDATDFAVRKKLTPSPSFAKSAVNDIKNSIFQRTSDVLRKGGSEVYQRAVQGLDMGVDLHGASMNTYIGKEILPELLTMARVGIYVDMPPISGPTLQDQQGAQPYLYTYKTEEILSWTYRRDRADEFQSVLLRDWIDDCDDATGLPCGQWCRFRHVWLQDGKVHVKIFDDECSQVDLEGDPTDQEYILDIDYIPFVILELTDSLLADVANHQIALLNLESSDISYLLKAGYPFYVEQQDPKANPAWLKQNAGAGDLGTQQDASTAKDREIRVGVTQGRTYGLGLNAPTFIHPSSEPIMASMEKQKNLKDDIRQLVNLALSNIKPKMASAESKALDERGLESGLSYIGLELEHAERKIAKYWGMYDGAKDAVLVQYPKKYSLQTDEDRRQDAKQLEELRDSIPSDRFSKSISKQIVTTLMAHKMSVDELETIYKEIENAKCYTAEPDVIFPAVEAGVMSLKIAATLLGLPEDSVEQASKDHADRLKRIAESQPEPSTGSDPGARGVSDLSGDPGSAGKDEKKASRDTTKDGSVTKKVRGEGKNVS